MPRLCQLAFVLLSMPQQLVAFAVSTLHQVCTHSVIKDFQRLRYGQGPQPRHTKIWKEDENNMTRNMTKIWLLGPGSGSRAQKCDKNMKIIWKNVKLIATWQITLFSHFVHIIFIFLSHFWARDPDMDPKSHIFVIFLVIFYSYYFHIFVYAWPGTPVHTAIFESPFLKAA